MVMDFWELSIIEPIDKGTLRRLGRSNIFVGIDRFTGRCEQNGH